MSAPSNANTSGLEVVAHRMRQLHHEIDGPITGWMYCPPSQHPSGNARWDVEPLVTAASAHAAIEALKEDCNEWRGWYRKACEEIASEKARADRLAKALKAARGTLDAIDCPLTTDRTVAGAAKHAVKRIDAALQQETQP